jgi:hypothetical protein
MRSTFAGSTCVSERCAKRHVAGTGLGARAKSIAACRLRVPGGGRAAVSGRHHEDVSRRCVQPVGAVGSGFDDFDAVGDDHAGQTLLAGVPAPVSVGVVEHEARNDGRGEEERRAEDHDAFTQ